MPIKVQLYGGDTYTVADNTDEITAGSFVTVNNTGGKEIYNTISDVPNINDIDWNYGFDSGIGVEFSAPILPKNKIRKKRKRKKINPYKLLEI